jgi:predicted DNA-binding transcriptional regulator AlpA
MNDLINVYKLARLLKASCRTVNRMVKRRDLPPGIKVGPRLRRWEMNDELAAAIQKIKVKKRR